MTIKEPSSVVFLNEIGEPLPDWLQGPLFRQVARLTREFPGLGGDVAAIQNLLDQVGQRVVRNVNAGLSINNVIAYVDTAATNAAIDELRRCHVTPVNDDRLLANVPAPLTTETPDLWAKAFELLNAQEEEIVVRYFWYGDRHAEIAAEMGLTDTAVRSRFCRALDKIRRRIGLQKRA